MMIEYTLLTTLAFHHLVIGSILFSILTLINQFIPSSAELRSWLWMTAFVVSTVVPFTLITPDAGQSTLSVNSSASTTNVNQTNEKELSNNPIVGEVSNNWHLPSEIVFDFSFLLTLAVFVWLFGSIRRAVNVLASYRSTQYLLNTTIEKAPSLSSPIENDVYTSTRVASPLVVGLIKPKIIIPKSITEQLKLEQLQAIVLHENAHIKRKDNWFGLFQEIIAISFWWSPVI